MIAAVRAGFVYDLYLSDGAILEGFAHWALLEPGDDLEVEHNPVHVERVLRVEDQHYVVYATRERFH
ncbi:MAG: hypothetical protein QOE29_1413 [Gaiellaceae bacterium]|jgi:hypothetical protein|nr:hypothetical protein [Gaiellaceae bacterium]